MIKHLALLLALVLACAAPLALAAEDIVINDKLNLEEMLTIKGELVKIADTRNLLGDVELGFVFLVPEAYNGYDWNTQYPIDPNPGSIGYVYIPDSVIELHREMMNIDFESDDIPTEEEYYAAQDKVEAAAIYAFAVMCLNPAKEFNTQVEEYIRERYEHIELITENGDDKIYLCWNTNLDNTQLTDEEKVTVEDFVAQGLSWVREGLMVFPPENYYDVFGYSTEEIPLEGGPEAFDAEDLYGNPFNAVEEFGKYDLTIVNVWATTCNPCIEEMPALQQLKEALPSNVNLITVCLDGGDENILATAILESMNVDITTLKGEELGLGVLKNVTATPTNLFINRNGNQVGTAIVGAMASLEKFVEQSMDIINERLGMPAPVQ